MTFKQKRLADEIRSQWTYNHQHTEEEQFLEHLHWCLL